MTQIDIFEALKTENNLKPRQWKLYTFLKETREKFKKQEEMLLAYETWLLENCEHSKYSYGYFSEREQGKHYSDMTSARNMRKDIQELKKDDTIQKVICTNKLADSVEEAEKHLTKTLAKILRELKLYHKQKAKLEKHLQTRLTFNQEKEIIEAVRGLENGIV
jgi:hypothetical protein